MEKDKMNRVEGFNEDSPASYRLNTMVPFDVFTDFVKFCKDNSNTGLGHFDFGVGLRILLMKAQYADMIFELDKRLDKVESQSQVKAEAPEEQYVKTFGITKKQEANNG